MTKIKCMLKDCRLRNGIEIPEELRDYSLSYPFNRFGDSCLINDCRIRVTEKKEDDE